MAMQIITTAFKPNEPIPLKYSRDGDDVSPALSWTGAPTDTQEFALIMDDPDAPTPQPWVHWVMYKIPPNCAALSDNLPKTAQLKDPSGALQGKNSWNLVGYNGPQPPHGHGTHHYHFRLYALDAPLDVAAELDKGQVLSKLKGHILAEAEIVGTHQR